ncbi:uncharacterized protein LOC122263122, partial [Penaeus japonicus]|uniref:uncharacterized protein LOC122263122 n=1 Tax=Penaeus japonicus TaxID=27405 RepID=UPI001C70CA73
MADDKRNIMFPSYTALPILPVIITPQDQPAHKGLTTCALLDSGSTRTFCSRRVADSLGLRRDTNRMVVTTLLEETCQDVEQVELMARGICTRKHKPILLSRVIVMDSLPKGLHLTRAGLSEIAYWPHLKDLPQILDKTTQLTVELLIGLDAPTALMPVEVRRGRDGELFAVRTRLGWAVNGPLYSKRDSTLRLSDYVGEVVEQSQGDARLEEDIKQFWGMETQADEERRGWSVEDQRVIDLWDGKGTRVGCHHQLPIPFRDISPTFPDNWGMARRRLNSLKTRLEKDTQLRLCYTKEIQDLLSKGFAEAVRDTTRLRSNAWYLPHHPVFNPNRPEKTRVVFDCAATFNGVALNQKVMQGPALMNDLFGILLRFREGLIAIAADIEAMFHQVIVPPEDRDVLRFLWWPEGDLSQHPATFRLTVHPFGGVWSPACASFALNKTLDEFGGQSSAVAKRNFYVDDLILSADSETQAIRHAAELKKSLKSGGFRLTKWMSNAREVLQAIPACERSAQMKDINLAKDNLPINRALGVLWDLDGDMLRARVSIPEKPPTRRGILSIMSSVFDPLGVLAPFTVRAKKIFQDEVRRKLGWDESLTPENMRKWKRWMEELAELESFQIPRHIAAACPNKEYRAQLHHFCDASQCAYATVTYLRLEYDNGHVHTALICARARLAPIKTMSIPRLELCAAVLAAQVDMKVRHEMTLPLEDS